MKAKVFDIRRKKVDQRRAEMKMTPQERLYLAFELIELAFSFAPKEKAAFDEDDSITWIELKSKNGTKGIL